MSFEDMMYEDGFTDPEDYLQYLQAESDRIVEQYEKKQREYEERYEDFLEFIKSLDPKEVE